MMRVTSNITPRIVMLLSIVFAGSTSVLAQSPVFNLTDGEGLVQFASAATTNAATGCGCDAAPHCGCEAARHTACDAACDGSCGGSCERCRSDCAWTLFGPTCCGVQVGGWVSGGATFNRFGNRTGSGNLPLGFNNMADTAVANQVWAYAAKEADTGGYGTDWGFRVDYVWGADGPNTQSFGDQGWDFGWNSSRDYGSAIPQIYGELAYNDLSVKFGHFFTIIGYEVVPATGNFFYSHALTMNYGEPFTHTGALGTYQYNACTKFYAGWTTGWDGGFDNFNEASTGIGGISYDFSDRGSITWAAIAGRFGNGQPNNDGKIYMNSIVLTYELSDRVDYVLQHDYGTNFNLGPNNNQWYGVNQYLLMEINECWALGGRFEWFRDDDGARIGTGTAGAGHYYNATVGLNWMPTENLRVRPEVRFDWFDGTGNPYDNGTQSEMTTFGIDGIFTF